MKYFTFQMTRQQADATYNRLVFNLHPDHNNSPDANNDFITLKEEYDDIKVILKYKAELEYYFKPTNSNSMLDMISKIDWNYTLNTADKYISDITNIVNTGSDVVRKANKIAKKLNKKAT